MREAIIIDRDYVTRGNGRILCAEGTEALLCQALFCLTARRGSFPFLPELGSRLWQLKGRSEEQIVPLATAYAAEALAQLGLGVQSVRLIDWQEDSLRLDFLLQLDAQRQHVEVTV